MKKNSRMLGFIFKDLLIKFLMPTWTDMVMIGSLELSRFAICGCDTRFGFECV